MKLLENFKLDSWYRLMLYFGAGLVIASFIFKPDFIESKHIFGFGLGMIIIGFAYLMSEKYVTEIAYGGLFSARINKHNFLTIVMLIIGLGIISLSGFKFIQTLV